MTAALEDTSEDRGCAEYGCGCLMVFVPLLVAVVLIPLAWAEDDFSTFVLLVPLLFLLITGIPIGLVVGGLLNDPFMTVDRRRKLRLGRTYVLAFSALCLVTAVGVTLRPAFPWSSRSRAREA